jgi:hypothetical protein
MRKSGIKHAQLHPHSQQVRDAFVAMRGPADWRAALEKWY